MGDDYADEGEPYIIPRPSVDTLLGPKGDGDDGSPFVVEHQEEKNFAENIVDAIEEDKNSLKEWGSYVKDNWATKEGWQKHLKRVQTDWKSGFTVALVNLPLSISLSVAADSTPTAGVLTCIWAGLFSSLFGGCVYNIVGPTGALSGILSRNVAEYGIDALPYLTILTGIISFIIFLLRWERYVLLVPASVMEGFTLGVAVIIGLNQINFAMGLGRYPRHEAFVENVRENLRHTEDIDGWSCILFILSFGFLMGLVLKWRTIPWVIVICVVGIAIGWASDQEILPFGMQFQTLHTRFGDIAFKLFIFPEFKKEYVTLGFISSAFSITFVAILETLISAKVADTLTKTKFKQRREVFAISLANLIPGIFGAIPATAALARTALNIKSGATSRMSGLLNVVIVTILSAVLLRFFKFLPLPVVAGIIVFVAVRMVDHHHFINFWKLDKTTFFLSLFCAFICIVEDPTMGIVVGVVLSMLMISDKVSNVHSEMVMTDEDGNARYVSDKQLEEREKDIISVHNREEHLKSLGLLVDQPNNDEEGRVGGTYYGHVKTVVYKISGQLTYVNGSSHKSRLQMSFDYAKYIVISVRYVFFMDVDGIEALHEIISDLEARGKKVYITGLNRSISGILGRAAWFRDMQQRKLVHPTYLHVLEVLEKKEGEEEDLNLKVAAVSSLSLIHI
eukprot:TRINITY_DN2220_c0_g2_i1.p1 TRINITY_DN2220_c0_g2~~TRINITY_DN2220_c0_g2_i1.p1  ORF type:complete len:726 (-),score=188.56 TRINITY_DN2220_c0_g2_i1:37-2070(-)